MALAASMSAASASAAHADAEAAAAAPGGSAPPPSGAGEPRSPAAEKGTFPSKHGLTLMRVPGRGLTATGPSGALGGPPSLRGAWPLHAAAAAGHAAVVDVLLREGGCDPDVRTEAVSRAARAGRGRLVCGVRLCARGSHSGSHEAAAADRAEEGRLPPDSRVSRRVPQRGRAAPLERPPAPPSLTSALPDRALQGLSALHLAAHHGHGEVVATLLRFAAEAAAAKALGQLPPQPAKASA